MKTAIIYRSNENLDKNLAGLKDKVDLFYAFPAGTGEIEIIKKIKELLASKLKIRDGIEFFGSTFDQVICDVTCYLAISSLTWTDFLKYWDNLDDDNNKYKKMKLNIINQSSGLHEEYVNKIAVDAKINEKDVVIIKQCLAHHCVADGIDPYQIIEDGGRDTWYLDKVIKIWEDVMESNNVECLVADNTINIESLIGKIVVCDDHNDEFLVKYKKQGKFILKSSYMYSTSKYSTLEEISILLEK